MRSFLKYTLVFVLLLSLGLLTLKHYFLPRYFESLLSRLFDLPVHIESIFINPFSGRAAAKNIQIMNPKGFSRSPHLQAEKIYFQIHLTELLKKHVAMDYIYLENVYYLIEKRMRGEIRRSNIRHWIDHMKRNKKPRTESVEPSKWKVRISSIQIHNGTFVYDSRKDYDLLQQYYFDRIYGELGSFEWPSPNYKELNQTLRLTARIGEEYPAPLEIHGRANFATSHVSFDLTGVIPSGEIKEFERFWSHLPVRVESGRYRLETRFQCSDKDLTTNNILEIQDLHVKTQGNPLDRLWGVSWVTMIKFLESKKLVSLNVPVTGRINSPTFEYSRAFSDAVKSSLSQHVSTGIKVFTETPAQLAAQTKELVSLGVDVGKKIVNGNKS